MVAKSGIKLDDYNEIFFDAGLSFFLQVLIMVIVLNSALTGSDKLKYEIATPKKMVLRLICAYLYHFSVQKELVMSFKRLKFLVQNPDKIYSKQIVSAFLVTQFQIISAIANEMVVLLFMTRQETSIDLIMNFVAFEVIIHIDNYFVQFTRKTIYQNINNNVSSIKFIRDSAKEENGLETSTYA